MAQKLVVNAKMRRTGICGATETVLIDKGFAQAPSIVKALLDAKCEVRGDAAVQALDSRVVAASDADWDPEYLDAIVSVRLVDGLDETHAHIAAHARQHTDANLTEDGEKAERSRKQQADHIARWT